MIIKIKNGGDICSAELVIDGLLSVYEDFKTLDVEFLDNEAIDEVEIRKIRDAKSVLEKIRDKQMYPAYIVI